MFYTYVELFLWIHCITSFKHDHWLSFLTAQLWAVSFAWLEFLCFLFISVCWWCSSCSVLIDSLVSYELIDADPFKTNYNHYSRLNQQLWSTTTKWTHKDRLKSSLGCLNAFYSTLHNYRQWLEASLTCILTCGHFISSPLFSPVSLPLSWFDFSSVAHLALPPASIIKLVRLDPGHWKSPSHHYKIRHVLFFTLRKRCQLRLCSTPICTPCKTRKSDSLHDDSLLTLDLSQRSLLLLG